MQASYFCPLMMDLFVIAGASKSSPLGVARQPSLSGRFGAQSHGYR
jgi:hypothetical protein